MKEKFLINANTQNAAIRLRNAVAGEFPGSTIVTSWPGYTMTSTSLIFTATYITARVSS